MVDVVDGDLGLPRSIGRYLLQTVIASGGMATVYKGKLDGPHGFARTVAIKRLHPHLARDAAFVSRFAAEARLAARIHHANVVQTLDFVETEGERFLVLDFVEGATLATLMAGCPGPPGLPIAIAAGIMLASLRGLTAAHELCGDDGSPLKIIHRDFSPQNLIVGEDGVARVLDFGIAKVEAWQLTQLSGQRAGKLGYMSPEQVDASELDQRSDIFAAGIVLWEALTGHRLFGRPGLGDAAIIRNVLLLDVPPPSTLVPEITPELDAVVLRALQRDPDERFPNARSFAAALEAATRIAASSEIANFVQGHINTAEHPTEPISSPPLTPPEPAPASSRRSSPPYALIEPTAIERLPISPSAASDREEDAPLSAAPAQSVPRVVWIAVGLVALVAVLLVFLAPGRPGPAESEANAAAPPAADSKFMPFAADPARATATNAESIDLQGLPVVTPSALPLEEPAKPFATQPGVTSKATAKPPRLPPPTSRAGKAKATPLTDKGPNGIAW